MSNKERLEQNNVKIQQLIDLVQTKQSGNNAIRIDSAELPNRTLTLYKVTDTGDIEVEEKSTGDSGGKVSFFVSETGKYKVECSWSVKEGDQFFYYGWTSAETEINDIGVYNIKSGKALKDYTLTEINTACKAHYAQWMFKPLDFFYLSTFDGSTSETYTKCYLVEFETQVDENDKPTGATFVCPRSVNAYRMSTVTDNRCSYQNCLVRSDLLPPNTEFYVGVGPLSSSTEGTYYILENDVYVEKTLPTDYVANSYYYLKTTSLSNLYNSMPTELVDLVVPTKQTTWKGSGFAQTEFYTTIDKFWMPSGMQMYGEFFTYTGYSYNAYNRKVEGQLFKGLSNANMNNIFCINNYCLTRSPSVYTSGGFANWNSSGYVSYGSAGNIYGVAVAFNL